MRKRLSVLVASCAISFTAWAGDKPVEVKPGDAIPSGIITTNHLGPFKNDMPAVPPMVVVSFQTEASEDSAWAFSRAAICDTRWMVSRRR
jgi:hypothetical protein